MSGTAPDQKAAELINTALTNLQQLGGEHKGPQGARMILDVSQVHAQLATASALLAVADAIEVTGQRLEAAMLRAADQSVPGTQLWASSPTRPA